MRILAIETSCDETAVALLEGRGRLSRPKFNVLGNALFSQVAHRNFGGVVPSLAKREHARNLVPLLEEALIQAKKIKWVSKKPSASLLSKIKKILEREPGLYDALIEFTKNDKAPKIDFLAVTNGPGLEPALWVGVNFARALSLLWDIPIIPINHMEGHIVSALGETGFKFPALALLVSGGHTELILIKDWFKYKRIGETRDDAAGEAFDKVARMLGLPYPGGPEISKLAEEYRSSGKKTGFTLPRPMITSKDFDFSFSGLKTAVLYTIRDSKKITDSQKQALACEFENAVVEVLTSKARRAITQFKPKTLIVSGGVSANTHLREECAKLVKEFKNVTLSIPSRTLSTDNAIMIGMAGFLRAIKNPKGKKNIKADGNLKLG